MFNVFSEYLSPLLEAGRFNLKRPTKPSIVYENLRIAYNQGVKGIENCTRLFVTESDDENELAEYIFYNNALHPVVRWINKNILLEIGHASYVTIGVKIRIATSMMNCLVTSGELDKDIALLLHSNLTLNVNKAIGQINTEDLPF